MCVLNTMVAPSVCPLLLLLLLLFFYFLFFPLCQVMHLPNSQKVQKISTSIKMILPRFSINLKNKDSFYSIILIKVGMYTSRLHYVTL